jgi:hypothetical protein
MNHLTIIIKYNPKLEKATWIILVESHCHLEEEEKNSSKR